MNRILIVTGLLIFSASIAHAESADILKERQRENKLTKTTPNIYKVTAKTGVAFKVQTAIGYITTIDLPENAMKVFVGDAELFKVEVYDKQIVVKPLTDYRDAKTNLTAYTKTGRLSFDVSVGPAETADFVVDFRFPTDDILVENAFQEKVQQKKQELEAEYQEKVSQQEEKVAELTQEKFEEELAKGALTKKLKISEKEDGIQINLLSLSEIGAKSYVRFSVLNYSDRDYKIQNIILGKETVRRKGFNLRKEGFIPVDVEVNVEHVIPANSYHYGLLHFDKTVLRKNERLVLKVYEDGKTKPIRFSNIPWEVK